MDHEPTQSLSPGQETKKNNFFFSYILYQRWRTVKKDFVACKIWNLCFCYAMNLYDLC